MKPHPGLVAAIGVAVLAAAIPKARDALDPARETELDLALRALPGDREDAGDLSGAGMPASHGVVPMNQSS